MVEMQQLRLLKILFMPSFLSLTMSISLTIIILAITALPYAANNVFLTGLVSIDPVNLNALLVAAENQMVSVASIILDRTELYIVFITIAAATIGLLVFATLELITRGADDIKESVEELRFAKGRIKERIEREIIAKWSVRGGAIIGWAIYWGLWINIFVLFSIFIVRIGFSIAPDIASIGYITFGTAILIASLHLHVIFLRLITLRPRVFGIIE